MGIRKRSNEVLVSMPEGIAVVRLVRRIPFEKRWGMVSGRRGISIRVMREPTGSCQKEFQWKRRRKLKERRGKRFISR